MLSLSYKPNTYQTADNLLPTGNSLYQSRPGFSQVVEGNIQRAVSWETTCLLELYGGLYIWDRGILEKLGKNASLQLSASPFMALKTLSNREKRLYVGNGETLFYIRRETIDDGTTVKHFLIHTFENELTDKDNKSYKLPQADIVATWHNRLWAADGTNIIYHCTNDKPNHWDPINAIAIQGGSQSTVTGLFPLGDRLIISTPASLWQITGNSPYNWQVNQVVYGHGAINTEAGTTDGHRFYYMDGQGIYELGRMESVSDPIKKLFETPDSTASLQLDSKGIYLYALINRRLMVYNTHAQYWGEIKPSNPDDTFKGIIIIGGNMAVYGDNGLWLESSDYAPDCLLNGEEQPVSSKLRSWSIQPNEYGSAALNRIYINVEGGYQGTADYRVYKNRQSAPIAEDRFSTWLFIPQELPINKEEILYREGSEQHFIEIPLNISAKTFEHEVEAKGFIKFHGFDPRYQFTERIDKA
ncbi:hypothetical protein CI610_01745 [invertebrate metagenome]|uniref:Uncharacterized protein n=1 Tax=invertebrate metagenome TaxID=1711999 RepID=A0A2H9T7S8_9ZZZZ